MMESWGVFIVPLFLFDIFDDLSFNLPVSMGRVNFFSETWFIIGSFGANTVVTELIIGDVFDDI